jgi:hypothetical protein
MNMGTTTLKVAFGEPSNGWLLRRLQTSLSESDFEERWMQPFPKFEMTALTELLTERGLLHQKARI